MDTLTRTIDVLLFEGVNLLDVAGPVQVFQEAQRWNTSSYSLRFVSIDGRAVRACCGLAMQVDGKANLAADATDLLIPGGQGVDQALNNAEIRTLIEGWLDKGQQTRLISICSGALLLANAGILNDRLATTHWSRESQAVKRFPHVKWQLDRIYSIDGRLYTSAGVTAGIDLALAIIREDQGRACALAVARELVVFLQRSGGQLQFTDILKSQYSGDGSLDSLVDAIIARPDRAWTLDLMAEFVGVTPRTLTRRCARSFHESPMKVLERVRVQLSSEMISHSMPVAKAAASAGFGDLQRMQRAWKRQMGTTLGEYSKRFVPRVD